jgi:hypothetical protein
MFFILPVLGQAAPTSGNVSVPGLSSPIPYFFYAAGDDKPLTIVLGEQAGSSLDLCLNGLGPDQIQPDLSLAASPSSIIESTSLLCLDPPTLGFSQADSFAPERTFFARGVVTASVIQAWLGTPLGAKYGRFYLVLPGGIIRIVSGLYEVGGKIAGIFSISPWY